MCRGVLVIRKNFIATTLSMGDGQELPGVQVGGGERAVLLEEHVESSRGMKGHRMGPGWLF